jgi:hypothetical protein
MCFVVRLCRAGTSADCDGRDDMEFNRRAGALINILEDEEF